MADPWADAPSGFWDRWFRVMLDRVATRPPTEAEVERINRCLADHYLDDPEGP